MNTSTSWIEDSATITDNGKVTFEHDGIGTGHRVRMVHLDGTPIGGWRRCDDCDTTQGDTAVITGLRAAFEDLEQIAFDNVTDVNVSRLITNLHDHFDLWMRNTDKHDQLVNMLQQWLSVAQDLSGIEA